MPRYDDDDRPRRSARKKSNKRKKGGNGPLLAAGGVGLLVVVIGLFFGVRWALSGNGKPAAGGGGEVANAGGAAPNANAGGAIPKAGGVKYVPRESEKKFEEYRKAQGDRPLTDKEVFAVMGEPTRTDPPETFRRNGMTIVLYEAHWEVPGSGISSSMSFANGIESGSVIGLEVTPRK